MTGNSLTQAYLALIFIVGMSGQMKDHLQKQPIDFKGICSKSYYDL